MTMDKLQKVKTQELPVVPFDVSLVVTSRNCKPCIELRRVVTDTETIKTMVSCAFHNRPVVIMPRFSDTMQSLNNLIEKGIIYREGEEYFFTI